QQLDLDEAGVREDSDERFHVIGAFVTSLASRRTGSSGCRTLADLSRLRSTERTAQTCTDRAPPRCRPRLDRAPARMALLPASALSRAAVRGTIVLSRFSGSCLRPLVVGSIE